MFPQCFGINGYALIKNFIQDKYKDMFTTYNSFIPKDHQRLASVLPLVLSKTKPVSPGFLLRLLRFQMPSAATQVIKIFFVHGSARSATKRLTPLIIKAFFFLELESQDQAPVQADGDSDPWVARKKQEKQ